MTNLQIQENKSQPFKVHGMRTIRDIIKEENDQGFLKISESPQEHIRDTFKTAAFNVISNIDDDQDSNTHNPLMDRKGFTTYESSSHRSSTNQLSEDFKDDD